MVVCFPEKLAGQIMQAFRTRYELHQSVYQHRGARAIDYILCDALISANDHLMIKGRQISEVMNSMEVYQHFDDRVLLKVQESDGPELEEARSLLSRIYSKPYYAFVGKTPVTDHSQHKSLEVLSVSVLDLRKGLNHSGNQACSLRQRQRRSTSARSILLKKNATASSRCFRLPKSAYEMFSPWIFEECSVRIFVKNTQLVLPVREKLSKNGAASITIPRCSRYSSTHNYNVT
ncbi:hypothetical protein PsorP6_015551 [Peronosclerospora sorghi]|uniref:Uncharacterized protein n=1 Tax=Peronosclerospora sorghi TaxID=230839 RepID=A0ACC0WQ04_9STRA|nr:hypothetical protein PsorP6_015551 [Peronosclerospora sorghi]